jgi:glycosyltransferase involved in cell wall biosynthesis
MIEQRKNNSVGYFSAYYRGLECLLKFWPQVRKRVPDATLDVYYGWESWVATEGYDDFYDRMEKKFAEMKDQGVTVHGRVDHETLAKAMRQTQVWAYPTEFPEIHCITALKAQEAGCWPVVTTVGALNEVVTTGVKIASKKIYTDEYKQKKFIEAVVDGLKTNHPKFIDSKRYWSTVAGDWHDFVTGRL